MNAAIATLEVQLATLENNEPIYRAEGNVEQADLCKQNAEEIREGLKALQHLQIVGNSAETI